MKKILIIGSLIFLTGCASFQAGLNKVNVFANKYGPIVGKDIIMVANILVQAECSPAMVASSQVATNVLNIVAPTSDRANTVKTILATNVTIAQQLCPLVSAVKAQVGNVPNVTPSQTVVVQ